MSARRTRVIWPILASLWAVTAGLLAVAVSMWFLVVCAVLALVGFWASYAIEGRAR